MTRPARLTSALLARKGEACPTGGFACPPAEPGQPPPDRRGAPRRAISLVADAPGRDTSGPARPAAKGAGRGASGGGRVALTLRLDRERHRQLSIVGARHQRTSQEVILKALDDYLAACGADCPCLRGEAERCTGS